MFSEAEYYCEFKIIRNKFRKYKYLKLIERSLAYMNAPAVNDLEAIRRQPWTVMLFIKWVLLDDLYPNDAGREVNDNDIHRILQSMLEMADKLRMPNEYEHLSLFFRNLAFQQFPYQIDFHFWHLSRQSILFSKLDNNHYIQKEFTRKTGLDIQDFIDLAVVTLARFLNSQETYLHENWFSTLHTKHSANKIKCFLSTISKDINKIREILIDKDNGKRPATEQFEATPFFEFPLIKVASGYILTHKNILFRRLEHYIYDIMRSTNSTKFMDRFGGIFERYVENSLKHSQIEFYTEKKLERILGRNGKQIDFLIQNDNSTIFIDAKAVEMNSQGKTTHSTEILRHKTKNSILKAIAQSHDVIQQITNNQTEEIAANKNNYLIVVTFKELYLGNGQTYYEAIAKAKMDTIYENQRGYSRIPPENMFFMTIDDLDILADLLKKKSYTFPDILEMAKKHDSRQESKKFTFSQHIYTLHTTPQTPDYLMLEKNSIFDRIKQNVSDTR